MQLSKNFSLRELTKSQTAARIGGKMLTQQQQPPEDILSALKYHCKTTVQKARDFFGVSIMIGSGYRGPLLNTHLKGSKTSQHCKGQASDQDLSESFVSGSSDARVQIDALVFAVTGKQVRRDVNANFYLFAYYVLFIQYCDVDEVIHEFGEDGQPEWVHVSSSVGAREKEILVARKNSKGKTYYTQLNTPASVVAWLLIKLIKGEEHD